MKIATIVSYCTNDYRFLALCLKEAGVFSQQLIVPVCDHYYDGMPEDRKLLERSYREHPEATFVEFAYNPQKTYGIYSPFRPEDEEWSFYWHSTSRYVGWHFLSEEIEYVLFLDVDEIVDAPRFVEWLKQFTHKSYDALRFYSHFYFRSPENRALSSTLNALMVRKNALSSPEQLLTVQERKGVFDLLSGQKINHLVGLDNSPLFDHYSWVRSKEELLRKVQSWGHRREKEWQRLLDEEFSHEFQGREELFGLHYEKVAVRPDFYQCNAEKWSSDFSHVHRVDASALFRKGLFSFTW